MNQNIAYQMKEATTLQILTIEYMYEALYMGDDIHTVQYVITGDDTVSCTVAAWIKEGPGLKTNVLDFRVDEYAPVPF